MRLIPVDDPEDPRVAAFMNVRDRDLAGTHGGLFVAEGETVLDVLVRSHLYRPRAVLVAANRLKDVAPLLAGHADLPVHVATQAVMDQIVGFPIHRGVIAVAERGLAASAESLLADRPAVVVGAVGIANHDNMGGLFRNAAAFGAGAVLIDRSACDPLYRKAVRVSVGGVLRVPFARVDDGLALVRLLRAHGYTPIGLSPRGTHPLHALDPALRPALVLGTEGPGLPDAVLAETETVRIDMAGGFDSLNVAVTAGIALYELTRRLNR
ncbi:TrmH family RNA methyltransferase [Mongoliimonas terrestris]|uniref:TrmH family RNA methyltransferase n=1 Tax=Mongoliimonas terrestris TaxID=1709001 RepID=UPI0009496924|nr:RNA methyltransferase [Mongoliimonas terrestris]